MKLEIFPLTEESGGQWNEFCALSDDAWFWHTTDWIKYTEKYKPELYTQNLSFGVKWQDRIVAIAPLTSEKRERAGREYFEFSFGGWYIPAPALDSSLSPPEREEILEFIFKRIDELARERKISRSLFRQTPLSPSLLKNPMSYNFLMKYGFLDCSLNTLLIDLKKPVDELWNDLRRNHKRNIKKGESCKIAFYTSENITRKIFDAYVEMHFKAAGRKTRPQETFEMMFDWIQAGLAFLTAVEYEGKLIGFEYYSVYKNNVYGFSAANDPAYEEHLPIRHKLEWEAILWMKRQGHAFYDIGLQQYGFSLHDFPDQKQLNISHFKKGYGGFTVPWFMGEKYYDRNYFLSVQQDRIKKYAESINSKPF